MVPGTKNQSKFQDCYLVGETYSDFGPFCLSWLQHILYRQKEQFSDGVGYSWIDGLKDHAASQVFHFFTLQCASHQLVSSKGS
jgi:phospholipase/lecithinase/hemolysin